MSTNQPPDRGTGAPSALGSRSGSGSGTRAPSGVATGPVMLQRIVVAALVLLVVPLLTFAIAVTLGDETALAFALICVVHVLLLVYAGIVTAGQLRARTPPRLVEAVPPLAAFLAALATLGLAQVLADAEGIRTSAVPRLRHGIPLPEDLPFVLSVLLAALAALVAIAALPLMMRRTRTVRALPGRIGEVAGKLGDTADDAGSPRTPRPPVTSAKDPLLRRLLSPASRVLLVLGSLAALAGTLVFALAELPQPTAEALTFVIVLCPAPAMLWAVLSSLWRRDAELGILMAALYRTMAVPVLGAIVGLLPAFLAFLVPPVGHGFAEQYRAAVGDSGIIPEGSPLVMFFVLGALLSLLVGMLGGLALSIAVIMPLLTLFRPEQLVGENGLSTNRADRRRNVAAMRLMSLLVILIFVFAILIADADAGEPRFAWAMVTLAVLVGLTVAIVRLQRKKGDRRPDVPSPEDDSR